MKLKRTLSTIIFLFLLICFSRAQDARNNICQMIKTEMKSFVDTIKSTKGDKGNHSAYVLTILENKPNYIEFRLNSFSDVHHLEDVSWNYCAMLDSEIILIQNLGLQSISLVQCMDPQMASRENVIRIKQKLYNINTFITGAAMYKAVLKMVS